MILLLHGCSKKFPEIPSRFSRLPVDFFISLRSIEKPGFEDRCLMTLRLQGIRAEQYSRDALGESNSEALILPLLSKLSNERKV